MSSMYGARGAPAMSTGGGGSGINAPKGYKQFNQFTPEQMQLFQSLFSHTGPDSFLSKLAGGDQAGFDEVEAPALKQFAGLQGNIASRFSGMGTGGRHSSGFQNTMNQASSDFAQGLQSQRQGLRRQAIQDLMGMSNSLLDKQPYGLMKKEHQPSGWESFLGNLSSGLGQGLGMLPGLFF